MEGFGFRFSTCTTAGRPSFDTGYGDGSSACNHGSPREGSSVRPTVTSATRTGTSQNPASQTRREEAGTRAGAQP